MEALNIIDKLGFERAIDSKSKLAPYDSKFLTLEQVKDFGIDKIYFCNDENGSYPAVFLKKVNCFDEGTLKLIAKIHHKVWNYKKVLFLYVYSNVEIRIYNCVQRPISEGLNTNYKKEIKDLELETALISDKQRINELSRIFSAMSIDSGIIWTSEEAYKIRKKINTQQRVDKFLVDSLFRTAKELQNQNLDIDVIHKIIMRSLFLLYLEDRGATNASFYSKFKKDASSYFDILLDTDATYELYRKLAERFNGNLFTLSDNEKHLNKEQLCLIKKCFISGNDGTDQMSFFENWRLFDFSIIQIELLSEIYENFLAKIDIAGKHRTGTFYTPPALVELILNEKLSTNYQNNDYNVKILDPACGSGIFLVESFKRLVRRYENKHGHELTDFDTLKKLLTDNIFGVELQPQAIKVAAFSLHLALVEKLNPKSIWHDNDKKLPDLINNPNDHTISNQGKNLFCRDTIQENKEIEDIKFDLVVGNPPFGTKELLPSIQNYCSEYSFAQEMVLPFLHKSVKFAPNGEIALIFNTKVLTNTNTTYKNFRRWLFNDCYVEKVYNFSILRNAPKTLGGQLFGGATGPISVVFFRKEIPQESSNRIVYYAPKTYVKTNVIEGVSIDNTDIKYLPREECQKFDTKIWKLAMWGGMQDWNLINKLNQCNRFKNYIDEKGMHKGLGLQYLDKSTKRIINDSEIPNTYILPKNIRRYKTTSFSKLVDGLSNKSRILYGEHYNTTPETLSTINAFRRIGEKKAYKAPHLLIKEGLIDWEICSSYVNFDCSFNSKVYGISYKDDKILKGLSCFLNSKLAYYYLFICSASIGIEREEIKPNEILDLPFSLKDDDLYKLSSLYDQYINDDIIEDIVKLDIFEKKVNEFIFLKFGITKNEVIIINDFINFTVPLIAKRNERITPLSKTNYDKYAIKVCNELNGFLEDVDLFANATIYDIHSFSQLVIIKLSFDDIEKEIFLSNENINKELKNIDKHLWTKAAGGIYFRRKMNYKDGDDVYLIRPNQNRFWTESMAMDDSSDLILEILNED